MERPETEGTSPAGTARAIDRYILKGRIAAGGMGVIYRAFDVHLKCHVALKVLGTLDEDSLERFVREREITADLDHPSFVRILSMGYVETGEGRRPCYAMPLLRGETLETMIRRRSRPGPEGERLRQEYTLPRLLQLVQQLCLALASAHDRGIIHRDVKPANVILGPYGELYIVDLGLAKYVDEGAGDGAPGAEGAGAPGDEPTSRALAGTPYFMAPEQVLDPSCVDARTDIFGLGAVLYYVLSGRRPLYRRPGGGRPPPRSAPAPDGTRTAAPLFRTEFLRDAAGGSIVPVDELVLQRRLAIEREHSGLPLPDRVDAALAAICMKALARSPSDRHPNGRALWRELQQYLEGRLEMILKREAGDLARRPSRRTLPTMFRDYELAERRLRQEIAHQESLGRLAIDEKLDLFDLLLDKAGVQEQRGDSESIIRSITPAEPILESAAEVLQRKLIQLLIAKGRAQSDQGQREDARATLARAAALSRIHRQDDLLAAACCGYGTAVAAGGGPEILEEARGSFAESIEVADRAGDLAQGIRARTRLALLEIREGGDAARARTVLDDALSKAERDPALRSEVHLALAVFHLDRKEGSLALEHAESARRLADEPHARNLVREAHFLLGQAQHLLGRGHLRAEHFKRALNVRGPRRARMEREMIAFYARSGLDPLEIGLRKPPAGPLRPRRSTAPADPGPSGGVTRPAGHRR